MKYALFHHVPWADRDDFHGVFDDLTEQVQLAERLGFHAAWVAEHHFSRYGLAAASLLLLTHLAAQTSRIRLGSSITIAPIRHPLHIAEQTATLDVLSDGRLDWGIGTGGPIELDSFGVARAEGRDRLREVFEIVRGLWTTPTYSHQGTFYNADAISLSPRPLQQPHPPVYLAATSPVNIRWAVENDIGFMTGVLPDTADALESRRCYFDTADELGRTADPDRIPFFRYVYVADSEEQVRRDTEGPINWVWKSLEWLSARADGHTGTLDEWVAGHHPPAMNYEDFCEHRGFFGTPDRVREQLRELRDRHGVTYFGGNFAFGNLTQQQALRSMELFATEVAAKL